MGIFTSHENSSLGELDFPCLRLKVAPTAVPLPGVLYRITIPKSEALAILSEFNEHPKFKTERLLSHIGTIENTQNLVTDSVYESLMKFQKRYNPNKNSPLYVCLIPSTGTECSYGCISRIAGVSTQNSLVMISFKGLKRAEILNPELNLANKLWVSTIKVIDEFGNGKVDTKRLQTATHEVYKSFFEVSKAIENFNLQYKNSLNNLGDYGHLLLLSPLANTLFFQLSRAQFSKSLILLKNLFEDAEQNQDGNDKIREVLTLMDITISILPTTSTQRLNFLSISDPSERIDKFLAVLAKFKSAFTELFEASKYVQYHFQNSSELDKSAFIANQLKSLKYFMDDIKKPRLGGNDTGRQIMSGKHIQNLVNDKSENEFELIRKFLNGLEERGVHPDGIKMLDKDFRRLVKMMSQNSEYQVLKNYFDIITDIPFGQKYSKYSSINLKESETKLNRDHYGLVNVKKRLIEYLSVLKLDEKLKVRNSSIKSPILLLVGPPGVGKTSIAKSVAEVLGRKFQRISLGGVHNEADIRGHRRTYVGSMCGLIVNALRKSGCINPLILLDEIDKVLNGQAGGGHGTRLNGDPGAALLEVLDPEQNQAFVDHYVGFPVDLSGVLFFCTANQLNGISEPLLDRMEVIDIAGYNPDERINIGSHYLLPKQIRVNGLDKIHVSITLTKKAWESLVFQYTREPGVRTLEKKLAAIVRGKVVEYVENGKEGQNELVTDSQLIKYLGLPLHPMSKDLMQEIKFAESYGVVNGLAYNSDGTGNVLIFEVITKGQTGNDQGPRVNTTGNLGSVLNESIQIATTLVKSIMQRGIIRGLSTKTMAQFLSSDIHLHVPMGAVSKDGPSAGAAIALCLLSLALKKAVPADLCMTGEITLRGKVLPIGGVKEKLLGAQMYGMKKVLIPRSNRSDVIEAVMESQDFESCLNSENFPEIGVVDKKMKLELHYVDDFYDVISQSWPTQITDHDVSFTTSRATL